MISQALLSLYQREVASLGAKVPSLHVVLGSGLGSELTERERAGFKKAGSFSFNKLPGFEPTTVDGHSGAFHFYTHRSGQSVCFQTGRYHGYEGHSPKAAVRPVLMAAFAGTKNFLLTNAAGSLTTDFQPGSAMIIRDHVNLTGKNPLEGPNPVGPGGVPYGPRFPDLTDAYDRELSGVLKTALERDGVLVHEGTYLGLLGPSFETPAEVRLFANWGLQAVGMSTVWETIALRHAGARVAGLSLMSNIGCGLTDEKLDHNRMMAEVAKQGRAIVDALFGFAAEVIGS